MEFEIPMPLFTNDTFTDTVIHPGTVFDHPRDVISHPSLTTAEKRAILASWASDASAIASCPALRAPDGLRRPVTIDEIREALCELDGCGFLAGGDARSSCLARHQVRLRQLASGHVELSGCIEANPER